MSDYIYVFQKGFNYSQDGPGNRLVFHLSGCNLFCPWCSNPEGLSKKNYNIKYTADELFNEICSCKMMFFENGGVTFTGGEVSLQTKSLLPLLKNLKDEKISTCIETNASVKDALKLMLNTDFVIADFKSPSKEKLKQVTGADIEIIKHNLSEKAKTQKPLLIRIPLIKNFNTGYENAVEFAEFFKELQEVSKSNEIYFEILHYHEFGKEKWEKLGLQYNFEDGFVSENDVKTLEKKLTESGLKLIKT